MMIWKQGVLPPADKIQGPIRHAMHMAHDIMSSWYDLDLWITSFLRPEDTESLHSECLAFDFRLPTTLNPMLDRFANISVRQQLHHVLGKDFDVVLEDDHIHVEYDPK